ncbi:hypothetical protein BDF14DRAFT_1709142, partial [Spinellus fusiger]
LKAELAAKNEAFERQRLDLETLNTKYVAEIEHVANIQYEKDLAERELEELSCQLFEEANDMVATEKRAKWTIENELKQTQADLETERSQCNTLQRVLQYTLANTPQPIVPSQYYPLTGQPLQNKTKNRVNDTFCTFLSQLPTSNKKLFQSAYVRQCQMEDIEPCLRLNPPPRISVKKLMEALADPNWSMEAMPEAQKINDTEPISTKPHRFLWDRFSSATEAPGCAICGRQTDYPLSFRFRMTPTEEWSSIDEVCREKLKSIIEFYGFIRSLNKLQVQTRSVQDVYSESIRYRLQIAYARMG